jgi:predicted transcriptional regulator
MQIRRNLMSILKAPPKQPRNATLQLRVDEELKTKLGKYAEFLDSTESYVVSEALKLVFNKDADFKEWLEGQDGGSKESHDGHAPVTMGKTDPPPGPAAASPGTNGNKRLFG